MWKYSTWYFHNKCWVSSLIIFNFYRKVCKIYILSKLKRDFHFTKEKWSSPKPKQDLLLCSAARKSMDTMHLKWTVTFQAFSVWAVITFSLCLAVWCTFCESFPHPISKWGLALQLLFYLVRCRPGIFCWSLLRFLTWISKDFYVGCTRFRLWKLSVASILKRICLKILNKGILARPSWKCFILISCRSLNKQSPIRIWSTFTKYWAHRIRGREAIQMGHWCKVSVVYKVRNCL